MERIFKTFGPVALLLAVLMFYSSDLCAQQPDIGSCVIWLESNQSPSGLWGIDKNTPFRDTEAALLALSRASGDPSVIADGMTAAENLGAHP